MGDITTKPWGYEEMLVNNGKYVVKRIIVFEGHRISLQLHKKKHETWFVKSGTGEAIINGVTRYYEAGFMVDIPPQTIHRLHSIKGDTELLEVSTPELGDVVRLEDDYGRTK